MLPALPVSGSTWTSTELNTTGPRSSVVKRVGRPLKNVSTTDRVSMPRMESRGPTMPTSVTKAVPPGRTRVSAVGMWVWLPMTALTRPSRYQASAALSLVAPAGLSTTTIRRCRHRDAATGDDAASRRALRVVQGAQQGRLAVQVGVYLAVVPDVVARRDDLDAGLEHLVGGAGRQPLAAGGVLAVGDDEVNAVAAPDAGQSTGQGPASHLPHHIADPKYVHCGAPLLVREAATGPTPPPSGKTISRTPPSAVRG